MHYTLDTNTISALLRRDEHVLRRAQEAVKQGTVSITAISYYETKRGLTLPTFDKKLRTFTALLQDWPVLPLNLAVLDEAARLYQRLRAQGQLLEDADLLIAACALTHNATLVSHNSKHFARVLGLRQGDWEEAV